MNRTFAATQAYSSSTSGRKRARPPLIRAMASGEMSISSTRGTMRSRRATSSPSYVVASAGVARCGAVLSAPTIFEASLCAEADGLDARKLGKFLRFGRVTNQSQINAHDSAWSASGHPGDPGNDRLQMLETDVFVHFNLHPPSKIFCHLLLLFIH